MRPVVGLAIGLAACLMIATAFGQARDPKRADELFQQGKTLFESGKYAAACAKLGESDRLDPAIGTLGLLAACHEKEGKLASAWIAYRETEARARKEGDNREAYAKERADALETQVPRLKISARGAEPGLSLTVDDRPAAAGELVALDPGPHTIVARAPGKKELRAIVSLSPAQRSEHVVPPLEAATAAAPPTGDEPPPPTHPPDEPSKPGGRRTLAYVAGGIGLVGIGVGSVFGIIALNKASEIDELRENKCKNGCTDATRAEFRDPLLDDAKAIANISTVGFIVGGVGLATGIVLYLTSGDESSSSARIRVTPVVGDRSGGTFVTGSF